MRDIELDLEVYPPTCEELGDLSRYYTHLRNKSTEDVFAEILGWIDRFGASIGAIENNQHIMASKLDAIDDKLDKLDEL